MPTPSRRSDPFQSNDPALPSGVVARPGFNSDRFAASSRLVVSVTG